MMLGIPNARPFGVAIDNPQVMSDRTLGLFDVRRYGAVGDGITDDTNAIRRAIRTASFDGGGTVYFPPGEYAVHTPGRAVVTQYAKASGAWGVVDSTINAGDTVGNFRYVNRIPSAALGSNGNICVSLDLGRVWVKAGGAWVDDGFLVDKGGTGWTSGHRTPDPLVGTDGDVYLMFYVSGIHDGYAFPGDSNYDGSFSVFPMSQSCNNIAFKGDGADKSIIRHKAWSGQVNDDFTTNVFPADWSRFVHYAKTGSTWAAVVYTGSETSFYHWAVATPLTIGTFHYVQYEPTEGLGVNGDTCVAMLNGRTWVKADGVWVEDANLSTGSGSTWLSGTATPVAGQGTDGSVYIWYRTIGTATKVAERQTKNDGMTRYRGILFNMQLSTSFANGFEGISWRGLTIDGGSPRVGSESWYGAYDQIANWDIGHKAILFTSGAKGSREVHGDVEDCVLSDWRGEILYKGGDAPGNMNFRRLVVHGCPASAFSVSGAGSLVEDCDLYDVGNGLENLLIDGSGFIVRRCRFWGEKFNTKHAVVPLIWGNSFCLVEDCTFSNEWNAGLYIDSSWNNVTVQRCTFTNPNNIILFADNGFYSNYSSIRGKKNFIFRDNTIIPVTRNCSFLNDSMIHMRRDGWQITGNTVVVNGAYTMSRPFSTDAGRGVWTPSKTRRYASGDTVITGNDFQRNAVRATEFWAGGYNADRQVPVAYDNVNPVWVTYQTYLGRIYLADEQISLTSLSNNNEVVPVDNVFRYPIGWRCKVRNDVTSGRNAVFAADAAVNGFAGDVTLAPAATVEFVVGLDQKLHVYDADVHTFAQTDFVYADFVEDVAALLGSETPATVYFSLVEDGTELTDRVAVTNNATNFPAAVANLQRSACTIRFAAADAVWTVDTIRIYDAATEGNILYSDTILPLAVATGKTVVIPRGDVMLTLVEV